MKPSSVLSCNLTEYISYLSLHMRRLLHLGAWQAEGYKPGSSTDTVRGGRPYIDKCRVCRPSNTEAKIRLPAGL